MERRKAILFGASGLVGGHCLERLLQEERYSEVIAFVRKPLNVSHPKLIQRVIQFESLEAYREWIQGEDVYSCLGTTFLKSPNQKDYTRIDFTLPLQIAKITLERGATQFALISASSANPHAPLFYSRIKGELEEAVIRLGFKSIYIMRPSVLMGKRKEFRPIEKMSALFLTLASPFLKGRFEKFKPIQAKKVAYVMVDEVLKQIPGVHYYENAEIEKKYGHP